MTALHCSESYCDLHDFKINTRGICLRQDALRRSEQRFAMPRSDSHDEGLAGAILRLTEMLEGRQERQPRYEDAPREPTRPVRRERRKGGTPL